MNNRCGHVYPTFTGKFVLVKFEGEKEPSKMALLSYTQCTKEAAEPEVVGNVATKYGEVSPLVVHNCAEHSYQARGKDISVS